MLQTHRLFMAGLLIAMFGVQLRIVDHFILTPKATELLNRHVPAASRDSDLLASYSPSEYDSFGGFDQPLEARRTVRPPEWLGWSLLSVGAVLILTSPIFR